MKIALTKHRKSTRHPLKTTRKIRKMIKKAKLFSDNQILLVFTYKFFILYIIVVHILMNDDQIFEYNKLDLSLIK